MLRAARGWASASSLALREIVRDPGIRRVELAWTASVAADRALLVALLVIAFQAAGPLGVAVLGLVRMLPSVIAAPVITSLGDRFRRHRILTISYATEAVGVALIAICLFLGGPVALILPLAGFAATANAVTRPIQAAFLPELARAPAQLIAANVATGTGEGLGALAGPVIGATLLVVGGPWAVAAVACAGLIVAMVAIAGVKVADAARPTSDVVLQDLRGVVAVAASGARALAGLPAPRTVIGAFAAQTFVRGMLTVLLVVLAISTPGLGEPGVGVLNAALGAGGLIGAVAAIGLAGQERLGTFFALGLVGWGVPIVLIGLWPGAVTAVALLILLGVSNAVLDVAGYTLLQGTVPDKVRAGVLGVMEGLVGAGVALGGVVGAVLVGQLSVGPALILTGVILPLVALLLWRRLRRADDELLVPRPLAGLLRGIPMFAPLSLAVLEQLAAGLRPVRFEPGHEIVRQGDTGHAFFIIVAGRCEVTQDGRPLGHMDAGDSFGEIALIRGVPRTATVRAGTIVEACRLGRADFLAAVTGDPYSASAAARVVDERTLGPTATPT